MDARVTFITLAVADVAASRGFYVDGLRWQPELEVDGEVIFFRVAPSVTLSLWSRSQFEAEVGPVQSGPGAPPLTLAHNMPDRRGVDEVLADAAAAGAPVESPREREWGGYSGYFQDPDGYRWEVAYNPGPIGVDLMKAAGLV
ncbi:VOC family protein [Microbacterium sp. P01]|uniref:VOC family protein n=1 Tax=unclassified Microbacterium TaxID=2609290 RepID=UPI0036718EA2